MKKTHIIAIIGGILTLCGSFIFSFLKPEGAEFSVKGYEFLLGQGVILLALAVIASRFVSIFYQKWNSYSISDLLISSLGILFMFALAVNPRGILGLSEKISIIFTTGYFLTLVGFSIILLNSFIEILLKGKIPLHATLMKIAILWKGEQVREKFFVERKDITFGPDLKNDFNIPVKTFPSKRFSLFKINPKGVYHVALRDDMNGSVCIDNVHSNIKDFVKKHTWNVSGENYVPIFAGDYGVIELGDLGIYFEAVKQEEKMPRKAFFAFDKDLITAFTISAVFIFSLILSAVVFFEESPASYLEKQGIKKLLKVDVQIAEEKEEDLLELGEEEDTVGKKAEGEEGKFGDPDEDPLKESRIPKRDGKMVSKIDPKKIGLNDLLSTSKLASSSALSSILNPDSAFSNKLAVAMSGVGSELVVGHGAGGMGFKGTGPGGGGTGGYGRIHGLGAIDTGGGMGVKAGLGAKGKGRIGKFSIGAGSSTGFCERGDIQRVVLQRAGAIRACYEAQLQIHQDLSGKVTARWIINPEGMVEGATIVSSTLSNSAVENCILRVMRRMKFKKPEGGICIVQWPFVFNPG